MLLQPECRRTRVEPDGIVADRRLLDNLFLRAAGPTRAEPPLRRTCAGATVRANLGRSGQRCETPASGWKGYPLGKQILTITRAAVAAQRAGEFALARPANLAESFSAVEDAT